MLLLGIDIGTLIDDLGIGGAGDETMRKARGDHQLAPILKTQLDPEPAPIGRRAAPDIDRHVEQNPSPTAHQLGLRMGWCLKMQPPHRADLGRQGVIILNEIKRDPLRRQLVAAIGLGKKAPRITKTRRRDDFQTGYSRFRDQHMTTFDRL